MTAAQLEQRHVTEDEVLEWRFEQLVHVGYARRHARLLSRRRDIDLHRAVELMERGCPYDLALSILL
jgi:hypothetical protein